MKEGTKKVNTKAFSLATMFLATTFVAVGLGLIVRFPMVGWPVAVIAIPVCYRTARIVQSRLVAGLVVSSTEKIKIFLRTLALVTGLVAFWCGAAIACLIGLIGTTGMFAELRNGRFAGYVGFMKIAGMALMLVVGAFGFWLGDRWNKALESRYQRDLLVKHSRESDGDD